MQRVNAFNVTGSVILGVFQLGLPYLLYSIALKKVHAIDGILIPILEPIWVFLFNGEAPGVLVVYWRNGCTGFYDFAWNINTLKLV